MHQSSCAMSIRTTGCWGSSEMGLLSQNGCRPLHKPTCRKQDHDEHSHKPSRARSCLAHPPNKEQPSTRQCTRAAAPCSSGQNVAGTHLRWVC